MPLAVRLSTCFAKMLSLRLVLLLTARLHRIVVLQTAWEVGVIYRSRGLNLNPGFYWNGCASTVTAVADHLAAATTSAAPNIVV